MEMTWAQTLTIIISMGGIYLWMWRISKEDTRRHEAEFQETRKLWAALLQKSAEIEKENRELKKESFIAQQEIRELMKKL